MTFLSFYPSDNLAEYIKKIGRCEYEYGKDQRGAKREDYHRRKKVGWSHIPSRIIARANCCY